MAIEIGSAILLVGLIGLAINKDDILLKIVSGIISLSIAFMNLSNPLVALAMLGLSIYLIMGGYLSNINK